VLDAYDVAVGLIDDPETSSEFREMMERPSFECQRRGE
jgi:hypothetical protein